MGGIVRIGPYSARYSASFVVAKVVLGQRALA